MKWYQFKKSSYTLADAPVHTHLIIQLSSRYLLYVGDNDQTKVYLYDHNDGSDTQLDVDPSNSSGDNKSRDHKIQAVWHDTTNQIVHFVDCDNTGDDFDVWKLDYSSSYTSPSVTEVGTSSGAEPNTVKVFDIFMLGSDVYVCNYEEGSGVGEWYTKIWDVTSSPFSEKDSHDWYIYD